MKTGETAKWKEGDDLPYVVPADGGMLAIRFPAAWLKPDRSGQPLLLPAAVRALDRLRALFAAKTAMTPGFIVSLREAMSLTQDEFAKKLGVSKMTISRWECGRMRPCDAAMRKMRRLQLGAQLQGVRIDGEKHTRVRSSPRHRRRQLAGA